MSGVVRVLTPEYYERLAALEQRHWWWRGMRRIAARLVERAQLPAGARVLDAGCGTGLTLSWMRDALRADPVGLDRSSDALRWCHGRGERRLIEGDAGRLPFADASFDVVISLDVLQHLPKPSGDRAAAAEFRRVLAPKGTLIVRTNSRCGRAPGEGADYQRYSLDSLRALLTSAGFDVLLSSYVNCLPALATTAGRSLRGMRASGTDPGLPALPGAETITSRIGYGWLCLEAAYLRRGGVSLPFGHSIVALAQARADAIPAIR